MLHLRVGQGNTLQNTATQKMPLANEVTGSIGAPFDEYRYLDCKSSGSCPRNGLTVGDMLCNPVNGSIAICYARDGTRAGEA